MSGYLATLAMRDRVTAAAEGAGLDLLATIDPTEAVAALLSDRTVVLVNPPSTTRETWTVQTHTFEVTVISPIQEPLEAWPVLDATADTLADPLGTDTERLTLWRSDDASGGTWPCVHLTLDTAESE